MKVLTLVDRVNMRRALAALGQWLRTGALPTPSDHPMIRFADYAKGAKAPPATADWASLAARTAWGMMGNSRYGDCVVAGFGHLVMVNSFYGRKSLVMPTEQEVVDRYLRLTGGADTGLSVGPALDDWIANPFNGGEKLAAWAQIDNKNLDLVKLAVAEFGGVVLVFLCPTKMFTEYYAGKPWTDWSGRPTEAHAILWNRYEPGVGTCVTWGTLQDFTEDWYYHTVVEAYVPIGLDWETPTTPSGIDLATLLSDFRDLQGVVPPPPPPPAPPIITGISPSAGPVGSEVTVSGSGLDGTRIFIDVFEAQVLGARFDNAVTVFVPQSLAPGPCDVKAVAANGSQAVVAGGFTVTTIATFLLPVGMGN